MVWTYNCVLANDSIQCPSCQSHMQPTGVLVIELPLAIASACCL